jgi:hypothetical protein
MPSGVYKRKPFTKQHRINISIGHSGEKNYRWHGGINTNYRKVHEWLRDNFGKATKCENPSCEHKSSCFQWALRKGCKYEKKIESFIMFCCPCHHKYDFTEEQRKKMCERQSKRISSGAKGKHWKLSEKSKRNHSKANQGKIPWNKGKKGLQIPWNKGKTKNQYPSLSNCGRHQILTNLKSL